MLLEAYEEFEEPKKLEAAKLRILKVFPDDLETLDDLASDYFQEERARPGGSLYRAGTQAEAPGREAARPRILDSGLPGAEPGSGEAMGRGPRPVRGRRARSDRRRQDFHFLARRAIFETKAGQRDLADRYEKEALALLVEPTPLWLVFHIESIRYKLTKATQKHYADLLEERPEEEMPERDRRGHGRRF